MNPSSPQVWECEHQVEVHAPPSAIWSLFVDVAHWPHWNAGVQKIEMTEPFVAGMHFVMTLPDGTRLTTRLVEVLPNRGFLDETRLGDLRVFVDHRIEAIDAYRTRVVYALEAFGPGCDEIGPAVSADFPAVLKTLAASAEALAGAAR